MRRTFLKPWIAAFAGLGLAGLAGSAFGQTTGVPGGNPGAATQGGARSPGAQSGTPGGNGNGIGGNTSQGTGGGALTQGIPGGMPSTNSLGTMGPMSPNGMTTGGNVGSYGRFVQPAGGSPGMFGNSPGMSGNSPGMFNNSNSMFGGPTSPFGLNRVGNSPVGTPGWNSQNGGAPYGTPGNNGVYAGNTSGLYTSGGGWGPAGTYYGGGYANNDIGYRGYSPYYGNNGGGLNSGPNGSYTSNYYGNAPQYYGQGMQAGFVPTGPGVGNLGYPNTIAAGSYVGNNAGTNPWPSNAGPSGNSAPTYYGNPYVPPNYNYGTGGEYAPSGSGVGNLGYPGAYASGWYPWF